MEHQLFGQIKKRFKDGKMQNDNIIEFQNVSYRYEADDGEEKLPLVVNNISLNLKKAILSQFSATMGPVNQHLPSFPIRF